MAQQNTGFPNGANDLRRGIDHIGIACSFVCHDGKGNFVLHKRSKNCRDEQGTWDNGAGSQEFGSDLEDTVRREVREEYGADALEIKFLDVRDAHRKLDDDTPTHWVSFTYAVLVDPKQVKNNEPYKIDDIGWFTLETLPSPLHSTLMLRLNVAHAAGII